MRLFEEVVIVSSFQDRRDTALDEVLTVEEVAKLLHASPWTIRLWIRQGRLPMAVRVGRRWLFLRSRVMAWLQSGGHRTRRKYQRAV